jgi:cation diffusion facilitator family transporter
LRATFIGLLVNTLFAAGKLAAGIFGHSHALIADAIESLSDIFSSLVVWRGLVVAETPPDEDHPYGHGKAEPLASAFVAAMLLLAAVWIAIQSIREIHEPHHTPAAFTLIILLVVVVVKEAMFRWVLKESSIVDSTAVRSDAWHHRSDAITSLAAGIGITVAIFGGQGYEAADDWAALVAAAIIALNGWLLLRPALAELMDTAPSPEFIAQLRALAAATPAVTAVEKCLVRKVGHQYFVDMHIEVDPHMTVVRAHEIAHAVKDRLRAQFPNIADALIHIEPAGQKIATSAVK